MFRFSQSFRIDNCAISFFFHGRRKSSNFCLEKKGKKGKKLPSNSCDNFDRRRGMVIVVYHSARNTIHEAHSRFRNAASVKILDITSHGNIPLELAPNPIAGIFSALVDEHLDGNVFICSKRLRIISLASSSAPPSALCVFLQIFHVSWKMLLALSSKPVQNRPSIYIIISRFFTMIHRGSRKCISRFPANRKRKEKVARTDSERFSSLFARSG